MYQFKFYLDFFTRSQLPTCIIYLFLAFTKGFLYFPNKFQRFSTKNIDI